MTPAEAARRLPPDTPLPELHDLLTAIGGDLTSFTGHLLLLAAKADPQNLARLRAGFPQQVAAWELWHRVPDLTAGELADALSHVTDWTPATPTLMVDIQPGQPVRLPRTPGRRPGPMTGE